MVAWMKLMKSNNSGRTYFLPVKPLSARESEQLRFIGADLEEERSWEQFEVSLGKAISGEYSQVQFPENFFEWSYWEAAIDQTYEVGIRVSILITPRYFLFLKSKQLEVLKSKGVEIEILVVAGEENSLDSVLQRLEERALSITLLMTKKIDALSIVARFAKSKHRLWFYFPMPGQEGDLYSINQVHDVVDNIHKKIPNFKVQPRPGVDIFEPRAQKNRDFEPVIFPELEVTSVKSAPEISVIIPSYNNKTYLLVVLNHLLKQDLSKDRYEIIVVDDGSNDGTKEHIINLIKEHSSNLNFKYIFFPRESERYMGDHMFRASIARNLGVKCAVGDIYSFLDSDIVTPPNYLSNLLEQHRSDDVIQGRRLELLKHKSHSQTTFRDIDLTKDTYLSDGGYWLDFIKGIEPWGDIENGWKYVCTHSLSVRAEIFREVGWFRKSFIFYGYEDTELGYRLWKSGAKFARNNQNVFHLYHADTRSEYRNSHSKKLILLSNTAPVFYLNSLSGEVYEHLKYLFEPMFKLKIKLLPLLRGLESILIPTGRTFAAIVYFLILSVGHFFEACFQTIGAPVKTLMKRQRRDRVFRSWVTGLRGQSGVELTRLGEYSKPSELVRYYYCEPESPSGWSYLEQIMYAGNENFDGIVFPKEMVKEQGIIDIFEFSKSRMKHIVLEVTVDFLEDKELRFWIESIAKSFTVHLYVSGSSLSLIPEIDRIMAFERTLLILQPQKRFDVVKFISTLDPNLRERIFFEFPLKNHPLDRMMGVDELVIFFTELRERFPGFQIRPVPGLGIGRAKVPVSEAKVEYCEPLSKSECPKVDVSIVVYMESLDDQFIKFIDFIARQDCSKDLYEIICVLESHPVKKIAFPDMHQMNVTWIGMAAYEGSLMTVRGCRSELAFELGADEAKGQVISFLTSDFVVRKNYVSDLVEKHKTYDVVIGQAYEPLREELNLPIETWTVNPLAEINLREPGSERDVNDEGLLLNPWIHIGHQGFSVKRELYHGWGGLRGEYLGTGVAVTEWGYRMWAAGAQFYINSRLFSIFGLRNKKTKGSQAVARGHYRRGLEMFFNETLNEEVFRSYSNELASFPGSQLKYNWLFKSICGSALLPLLKFVVNVPSFFRSSWNWSKNFKFQIVNRTKYAVMKPYYFSKSVWSSRLDPLFKKVLNVR